MRIVFMGAPEFAVPALERLVLEGHQVLTVYTQPDRAAGRGRALAATPVKRAAEALGLPVLQPVKLKDAGVIAELAALKPDVIVVSAFGEILPQAVLDIPPYKCINIHPSLLSKYRGASPVAGAILAGDNFAGVSIMLMDAGLDTGPILSQTQVSISQQDTTGSLTDKLAQISAGMLLEVLMHWAKGEIAPRPQDETGASYTEMIKKEEGEIDWHKPAAEICRRVRAFQPWPGCYTTWRGKQLKIIEAVPLPEGGNVENATYNEGNDSFETPMDYWRQIVARIPCRRNTDKCVSCGKRFECYTGKSFEVSFQWLVEAGVVEIGQVLALEGGGVAFGVNTGEGILGVMQVQLEGKKAMSAAEFLRGQSQLFGAVLPD